MTFSPFHLHLASKHFNGLLLVISKLRQTLPLPSRNFQEVASYVCSQGSSQLEFPTWATTLVLWRTGWPCRAGTRLCSTALWTCTPSRSLKIQNSSGATYWKWLPACWPVASTQRRRSSSSSLRWVGEGGWWMDVLLLSIKSWNSHFPNWCSGLLRKLQSKEKNRIVAAFSLMWHWTFGILDGLVLGLLKHLICWLFKNKNKTSYQSETWTLIILHRKTFFPVV